MFILCAAHWSSKYLDTFNHLHVFLCRVCKEDQVLLYGVQEASKFQSRASPICFLILIACLASEDDLIVHSFSKGVYSK